MGTKNITSEVRIKTEFQVGKVLSGIYYRYFPKTQSLGFRFQASKKHTKKLVPRHMPAISALNSEAVGLLPVQGLYGLGQRTISLISSVFTWKLKD